MHVPTAVIDADGHVVEPPAAWDALPDSHRPTIHRDDHGFEHVTVGDKEILAVPLGTLALSLIHIWYRGGFHAVLVSCRPDRVRLCPRSQRRPRSRPEVRAMGGTDEAKGRAKKAVGDLTDNDRLKNEGKVDQAKGTAKDAVDKVADKVTGK